MTGALLALALAAAGADGGLEIESFESPPPQPGTRVFGGVRAMVGINTRPDAMADPNDALARNLFELWGRVNLGADVKLSDSLRLVVEGRAFWRGTTMPGFVRAKATFEPYMGETFVDYYSPKVDVRAGYQVVSFGANALFAPADQLNPRDLRWGFLEGEPEDVKLPAPAVKASGEFGKVSWTAVYFPFFIPDRYDVFGTNESLIQPQLGTTVPQRLDASIEDQVQPYLLESKRPNAWPWLGDIGLRGTTQKGKVKLGFSWVWMNEKLPEVTLDSELQSFLVSQARGQQPDAAVALSLQNRFLAGETLFSGIYQRQHIFSAEASTLVGPSQLDIDLSYTPEQTFVDENLNPVRKSAVTWVIGLSQAEDSAFIYGIQYLGMAIPDVDAQQLLLLVEPATARGASRTAWLHLFVGHASYRFFDDKVEASARLAFDPIQFSAAFGPRVSYKLGDRYKVWGGADFYQGKAYSLFGYFNRANQVVLGFNADLF